MKLGSSPFSLFVILYVDLFYVSVVAAPTRKSLCSIVFVCWCHHYKCSSTVIGKVSPFLTLSPLLFHLWDMVGSLFVVLISICKGSFTPSATNRYVYPFQYCKGLICFPVVFKQCSCLHLSKLSSLIISRVKPLSHHNVWNCIPFSM